METSTRYIILFVFCILSFAGGMITTYILTGSDTPCENHQEHEQEQENYEEILCFYNQCHTVPFGSNCFNHKMCGEGKYCDISMSPFTCKKKLSPCFFVSYTWDPNTNSTFMDPQLASPGVSCYFNFEAAPQSGFFSRECLIKTEEGTFREAQSKEECNSFRT